MSYRYLSLWHNSLYSKNLNNVDKQNGTIIRKGLCETYEIPLIYYMLTDSRYLLCTEQ